MWTKILVPLDGSKYADKALDTAIELAKKYSASIVIIHVVPTMYTIVPSAEASYPSILVDLRSQLEDSGRKILEDGAKKIQVMGIPVTTVLETGNVSDKIIQTAEKEKADLIVIGHRGLGVVARFFLGSVANKVSHHSKCPVLIVKI